VALGPILEGIAHVLGDVLFEALFVRIFYWPGWLALRLVTLGRYPPGRDAPHNEVFVAMVGLGLLLAALAVAWS
jgi:hypothetical protein